MNRAPAAGIVIGALAAMGVAICGDAWAESGAYRVEVLIFEHLGSSASPRETGQLRSFRAFPGLDEALEPEAPVKLDVMSSLMQDNWRRLDQSGAYRPLLFAAWEQSRIDYHPPVRLHDEEVIFEEQPPPLPEAVLTVPLLPPEKLPPDSEQTDPETGDTTQDTLDTMPGAGEDSLDAEASQPKPPEPVRYYRLDGTVQLVRSRFLHLNLDLEFRSDLLPRPLLRQEPGGEVVTGGVPIPLLPGTEASPGDMPRFYEVQLDRRPGPAMLHALEQSRQVRTGELQYFDTPFLGVLARVTATAGE